MSCPHTPSPCLDGSAPDSPSPPESSGAASASAVTAVKAWLKQLRGPSNDSKTVSETTAGSAPTAPIPTPMALQPVNMHQNQLRGLQGMLAGSPSTGAFGASLGISGTIGPPSNLNPYPKWPNIQEAPPKLTTQQLVQKAVTEVARIREQLDTLTQALTVALLLPEDTKEEP